MKPSILEGTLQHHGTFAFLLSGKRGEQDLMIRGPSLRLAMDGDRVQARRTPGRGGRPTGEIVRVLERGRKTVVGVLRRPNGRWAAFPEDGGPMDAVEVLSFAHGVPAREGELVVVRITRWPDMKSKAGGTAEESLGTPQAPGARLRALLRSRELPEAFPEDALAESRRLPDRVDPSMWKGRLEVIKTPVFTIDGADAKDFDDAVSLEPLGGGRLRLGVHIADVSYYVRKNTPLDREAQKRATSVYMADRVVPMLPPKLADNLCSLVPEQERLTLSCLIDLDASGRVQSARFAESVIRSWKRFTYEEVEDVLKGRKPAGLDPRVLETVQGMGELAKKMTALRMGRGSLDFTMPEYKVFVDPGGAPLRVERRERLMSHRLIEEFMLAANEACARALKAAGAPLMHRIHEMPDPAKLETLARELEKMGVAAPPGLAAQPTRGIQEILRRVLGHPLEETIHFTTVRSLRQAVYSARPDIHFGLASKAYAHFTSPIRRYPDLFNHRAVREMLKGGAGSRRWPHAENVDVASLAAHCSARERLATEAERASVDLMRAQLLRGRVGETFEGVVSREAPMGVFVALPENGAVGLARGARAAMGARVKVRLSAVDEAKGELELELLGASGGTIRPAAPRPGGRQGGFRGRGRRSGRNRR